MRVWGLIVLSLLALSATLPPPSQAQQGTKGHVSSADDLKLNELKILLSKAQAEGYQVALQEDLKLVKANLVKEGKTQQGHGILDIKWNEREVWTILYVREGNKLKLASSEGILEKKAPVAGTWSQTKKLVGLPPPFVMSQ